MKFKKFSEALSNRVVHVNPDQVCHVMAGEIPGDEPRTLIYFMNRCVVVNADVETVVNQLAEEE